MDAHNIRFHFERIMISASETKLDLREGEIQLHLSFREWFYFGTDNCKRFCIEFPLLFLNLF